jgi:hypothetical protein
MKLSQSARYALPGPDAASKASAVRYAETDDRYASMLDIAAEHQWPACYVDDLYRHDRQYLTDNPGSLLFILRETGTQCYALPKPDEDWRDYRDVANAILWHSGQHRLNWMDDSRPLMFVVNPGCKSQPIEWFDALRLFLPDSVANLATQRL